MNKTLYVCHSGQAMDLSAIEDLFATVGDVETSQFVMARDFTRAMRIGILEMATAQQALDCMERFNGHSMNGHVLSVDTKPPKSAPIPTAKKRGPKYGAM